MEWLQKKVAEFLKRHKFISRWRKALAVMMALVVFVSTYAMVLPAITLETGEGAEIGLFADTSGDEDVPDGSTVTDSIPEAGAEGTELTTGTAVLEEETPTEAAPTEAAPTEAAPTEAAPAEAAPTEAAPAATETPAPKVEELSAASEEPVYLDNEKLIFENNSFKMTLTVPAAAKVSKDASLDVREIGQPYANDGLDENGRKNEYLSYLAAAEKTLAFTAEENAYIEKVIANTPAAELPWARFFAISIKNADGKVTPACALPVEIIYKNTAETAADGLKVMCLLPNGTMAVIGSETKVATAAQTPIALLSAADSNFDVTVKFTDAGTLTFGTFVVQQAKIDAAIEKEKEEAAKAAAEAAEKAEDSSKTEPAEDSSKTEAAPAEDSSETEAAPAEDSSAAETVESGEALPDDESGEESAEASVPADAEDESGLEKAEEDAEDASEEEKTEEETKATDKEIKTLMTKGADYTVTMTYTADAEIPAGAVLSAKEILSTAYNYNGYFDKAADALKLSEEEKNNTFARFFDIKIMQGFTEIIPAAPVHVEITYNAPQENTASAAVNAVHFGDEGPEVIDAVPTEADAVTGDVSAVEFEAGSFSVYGVMYTVDFEYEVNGEKFELHYPGNGSYKVADILAELGVEGSIDEAALKVIEGEDHQGALYLTQDASGEWYLNSDTAFSDVYELSVRIGNVIYTITVSDAPSDFNTSSYANIETVPGAGLTADTTAGTTVGYDTNTQSYSANVTAEFTIPTDTIKSQKNFYIRLDDSVTIPSEYLNQVKYAVDRVENKKSFEYYFKQGSDGRYYIAIEFLQDYLDQVELIRKNTVSIDLLFGELHDDDQGNSHVDFTENIPITVNPNEINYPDNDNGKNDIKADKSHSDMGTMTNGDGDTVTYIDYTVVVSSVKGSGKPITLKDSLSGLSVKIDGEPTNVSVDDIQIQSVTPAGAATSTAYEYEEGTDGKSFTLTLGQINGTGSYTVTYRYILDQEIPTELNDDQIKLEVWAQNNVTLEADPLKTGDNDTISYEKSNLPVTVGKSGAYNSDEQTITWTITLYLKKGNHDLYDSMFAEAVNSDISISREEGEGFTTTTSSDGKTIHFNDPGTYTITYKTSAPGKMYTTYNVTNNGNVDGRYYTGDVGVNVPITDEGYVEKSLEESELTSSSNGVDVYTLTWDLVFAIPDELPEGTVLKDTLVLKHSNTWNYTYHTFTEAQKNAFVSQIESVFGAGVFDVEFNNNNEIILTVKEDWTKPAGTADTASISYTTTATVDRNYANPGISNETHKDQYYNDFTIGKVTGSACFEYSREVVKIDLNHKDGSKLTSYTLNKSDKELEWAIVLNLTDNYNAMAITDTLPAGLTITKLEVGSEYNKDTITVAADGTTFTIPENCSNGGQNIRSITATKSAGGTTSLVVNLVVDESHPRSSAFTKDNKYFLVIHAAVDSSEFDALATITKEYTNNVSVSVNGNPLGDDYQTQKVTLDSQSLSKSTIKSAVGDLETAQADWETYHYLSYGVVINADAHTMNGNSPYSVEDVLAFNKISPDGKEISFSLVPNSVKLKVEDKTATNEEARWANDYTGDWNYQFSETKDGDMRYKTIAVSNVPDNTTLRLEYTYQVILDGAEAGTSYNLGDIANTATIHGENDYSIEHHESKSWKEFTSSASTVSVNSLTLSKVDLNDYNTLLPGTKFVLEKWDGEKWVVIDAISEETQYLTTETDTSKFGSTTLSDSTKTSYQVYNTSEKDNNKKGSLRFYMPSYDSTRQTAADGYIGPWFEAGVCYRAREYEAPSGGYYVENDPDLQPAAYFWFSIDHTDDVENAVDKTSVSWPNTKIMNLADDLSTESDAFYVTNAKTPSIKVTKKFIGDADLTDAQKKAMTFTIYWVGDDETVGTSDDKKIASLTYEDILKNNNVFAHDPDDSLKKEILNGRTYYVVEKGITLQHTNWMVQYILNSGLTETALETTTNFDNTTLVTSGTFDIVNNVGTVAFINKYDSEKTSIKVTKEWFDYEGNTVTNPSSKAIKFQVYQMKEDETEGSAYIPKGAAEPTTYEITFDTTTKTWDTVEVGELPKYYEEVVDGNGTGVYKRYRYYVVETDPALYFTTTYKLGENGEYGEASTTATYDSTNVITVKNVEDEPPHFTVTKQWFASDGVTDYTGTTTAEHVYFKVKIKNAYSNESDYDPVAAGVMEEDSSVYNTEKKYFIIDKIDNGDGTYSWETLDVRFPEEFKIENAAVISFYIQEVDAAGNVLTNVNTEYSINDMSPSNTNQISLVRGDMGDAVIENTEKYKLRVTKKFYNADGEDITSTITEPTSIQFNIIKHKTGGETENLSISYTTDFYIHLVDKADGSGKEWETFETVLPYESNVEYYEVKEVNGSTKYNVSYAVNGADVADETVWEAVTAEDDAEVVIKNTEKEYLKIQKVWIDDENESNRPSTITIRLYRMNSQGIDPWTEWGGYNPPSVYTVTGQAGFGSNDGGKVGINLNAANNWTVTILDLEKGSESDPWKYYAAEDTVNGYQETPVVTYEMSDGTSADYADSTGVISVANMKETTGIAVKKLWDVESDTDKNPVVVQLKKAPARPSQEAIRVNLYVGDSNSPYKRIHIKSGSDVILSGNPIQYGGFTKVTITGREDITQANSQGKVVVSNITSSVDIRCYLNWGASDLKWNYTEDIELDKQRATNVGDAVTLSDPTWYYDWPTLEDGYYYVEEVTTGYEVTYSNNDGIKTGTIIITNSVTGIDVTKVWKNDSDNNVEWPTDKVSEITLVLSRKKQDGTPDTDFGSKEIKVNVTSTSMTLTLPQDLIDLNVSGSVSLKNAEDAKEGYVVRINSLEETYLEGTDELNYTYEFTEKAVKGYKASYGAVNATSVGKGGTISNTPDTAVELPSTGGPGTQLYTMLGMMLLAYAGVMYTIILRRRSAARTASGDNLSSLKGGDKLR